ncbi:MAG: YqaE/Pmp3 family membrane protein [Magnetococcales bacterium]|nr:YqaE/Pmp3 family membrane protein [Magnetococcales bacterium]
MEPLIHVLLALFVPPVEAFFQEGFGPHFWLNVVLTLMFGFMPGVIHAVWLLVR